MGARVHVQLVVDLVGEVEVADTAGDRVLAVGEVEAHLARVPLGVTVLPRSTDDALEPVRRVPTDGIVKHDQATTSTQERFEARTLVSVDRAALGRIEDHHIGGVQLLGRAEALGTRSPRSTIVQDPSPLFEKARVVVLSGAVCFRPRADEDPQRVLQGRTGCGCREEQGSEE